MHLHDSKRKSLRGLPLQFAVRHWRHEALATLPGRSAAVHLVLSKPHNWGPLHVQDHIKPAARAVLDAIIDEIEAAESPDWSDDDDAASDEAAGDASSPAAVASPSTTLQARSRLRDVLASGARVMIASHPALTLFDIALALPVLAHTPRPEPARHVPNIITVSRLAALRRAVMAGAAQREGAAAASHQRASERRIPRPPGRPAGRRECPGRRVQADRTRCVRAWTLPESLSAHAVHGLATHAGAFKLLTAFATRCTGSGYGGLLLCANLHCVRHVAIRSRPDTDASQPMLAEEPVTVVAASASAMATATAVAPGQSEPGLDPGCARARPFALPLCAVAPQAARRTAAPQPTCARALPYCAPRRHSTRQEAPMPAASGGGVTLPASYASRDDAQSRPGPQLAVARDPTCPSTAATGGSPALSSPAQTGSGPTDHEPPAQTRNDQQRGGLFHVSQADNISQEAVKQGHDGNIPKGATLVASCGDATSKTAVRELVAEDDGPSQEVIQVQHFWLRSLSGGSPANVSVNVTKKGHSAQHRPHALARS